MATRRALAIRWAVALVLVLAALLALQAASGGLRVILPTKEAEEEAREVAGLRKHFHDPLPPRGASWGAPQFPPSAASAATRFGGRTYLLMGCSRPSSQRLNRSMAQEACAALNGRLAPVPEAAGDGGLRRHLADTLSNFTHATVLRAALAEAAANGTERPPAGDGGPEPWDNSGRPPAIRALWWADAPGELRAGHGAAWDALQGTHAEGGASTSLELPYVCEVIEPRAEDYSHPDMAALVALARHLLPLRMLADPHADPCDLFSSAERQQPERRPGGRAGDALAPARPQRPPPLTCDAGGRVERLQVTWRELSTAGGMLSAYSPGNWEARPLQALWQLVVTGDERYDRLDFQDPPVEFPFEFRWVGDRDTLHCPQGGCTAPWAATPLPGWLLQWLAPGLEHLALGATPNWESLPPTDSTAPGDEASAAQLGAALDLYLPDGLAAVACHLHRLKGLAVHPLAEQSEAERRMRQALGLPAAKHHHGAAAERLGAELLPACLGELQDLRSLQLFHRTELPMHLPPLWGKLQRLEVLDIQHTGPCRPSERIVDMPGEDLASGCGLRPPEVRREPPRRTSPEGCRDFRLGESQCSFARWRFGACSCTSGGSAALRGTLPPEWSGMASLRRLVLPKHSLSGKLPMSWASLGGMGALEHLDLSRNRLMGNLGAWLALASGSSAPPALALANSTTTGPAGTGAAGLPRLAKLLLPCNELHAPKMPKDLSGLSALQELDLSANRLQGRPHVLPCTLQSLQLSHNDVEGELGCFSYPDDCNRAVAATGAAAGGQQQAGRPQGLRRLSLADNRLHGHILPCLGGGAMPPFLDLRHQRAGPAALAASARLASACAGAGASGACVDAADELRAALSINGPVPAGGSLQAGETLLDGLALSGRQLGTGALRDGVALGGGSHSRPPPPQKKNSFGGLSARHQLFGGGLEPLVPARSLASCRPYHPMAETDRVAFVTAPGGDELQIRVEYEEGGGGRAPPPPVVLHFRIWEPVGDPNDVDWEEDCDLTVPSGGVRESPLPDKNGTPGSGGGGGSPGEAAAARSGGPDSDMLRSDRERGELWRMVGLLRQASHGTTANTSISGLRGTAPAEGWERPLPAKEQQPAHIYWSNSSWLDHITGRAERENSNTAAVDFAMICVAFSDHASELAQAAVDRSSQVLIAAQAVMLATAMLIMAAGVYIRRRGRGRPAGRQQAGGCVRGGVAEPLLLQPGVGLGKASELGSAITQWLLLELSPGTLCFAGIALATAAVLAAATLPENMWRLLTGIIKPFEYAQALGCLGWAGLNRFSDVEVWIVALMPAPFVAWRMLRCVWDAAARLAADVRRHQLREAAQQLRKLQQPFRAAGRTGTAAGRTTSIGTGAPRSCDGDDGGDGGGGGGEAPQLPGLLLGLEPLLRAPVLGACLVAWLWGWGLVALSALAPLLCVQAALLPWLPSALVLSLPLAPCQAGGRMRLLRLLNWGVAVAASPLLAAGALYRLDDVVHGIRGSGPVLVSLFRARGSSGDAWAAGTFVSRGIGASITGLCWQLQLVALCALAHVLVAALEAGLAAAAMLLALEQQAHPAGLAGGLPGNGRQAGRLSVWWRGAAWLLCGTAAAALAAHVAATRGDFGATSAAAALAAALVASSWVVHAFCAHVSRRCLAELDSDGCLARGVDGLPAAGVDGCTAAAAFDASAVLKLFFPMAALGLLGAAAWNFRDWLGLTQRVWCTAYYGWWEDYYADF